ncbi:MAG: YbjN domain-containing protein [archaeon]|nr:YbjN domain-containing protein [archaeon]
MEVFDGFIAAIASEFKIKFHKDNDGNYSTTIEFENNRNHDVMISLSKDESGDRMIHYHSIILKMKNDSAKLYKHSLELNSTIDYGAIVLEDNTLMLKNSILLHHCEPQRFIKSLIYIAAKADELEEDFTKKSSL